MEWTGEIARLPNSFLHECVATWVNLRLVWLKSRAPPSLLSFFQVVASALKMGSDMTCALLHPSCTSQVALDNLGWVRFAPTLAAFLSCLYLKFIHAAIALQPWPNQFQPSSWSERSSTDTAAGCPRRTPPCHGTASTTSISTYFNCHIAIHCTTLQYIAA